MRIPWTVLTHDHLQKIDLIVYVAASHFWRTTTEQVEEATGLPDHTILASLNKLNELGFLQFNNGHIVCGRVIALPRVEYPSIRRVRNKEIIDIDLDHRDHKGLHALARVRSRADAVDSFLAERRAGTAPLSPDGLLGLFYTLYKKHTGLDYRSASLTEEQREADLLAEAAGDLAEWCLLAFFQPPLDWVKNKTLHFLGNANNVHKFLVGPAKELRGDKKPEWNLLTEKGLVPIHRPKR